MAETPIPSNTPSGASTPAQNPTNPSRFISQNQSAEDVLKEQTIGLVHLSDFRKRRAEALEQASRDVTPGTQGSGTNTPDGRDANANDQIGFKKRKKVVKKKAGGLSFGDGEDDNEDSPRVNNTPSSAATPREDADSATEATIAIKRKLKPNSSVTVQPKALTKGALLREAQLKESLRKEYLQIQEAVRATEFCLPFVFFDGKDAPGGVCRMKKGDFIWLFLDRARKVGATAVGGSRKDWARIGVDDLMLVRGDLILPHHYDFHHFILNRTTGYGDKPMFPYSAEPTPATPKDLLPQKDSRPTDDSTTNSGASTPYLTTAAERRAATIISTLEAAPDSDLEGYTADPSLTKVVDRRWYERNKHIYPASLWEEFDHKKDYSSGARKDVQGNAFFFSSR